MADLIRTIRWSLLLFMLMISCTASSILARQKGQYVPGQYGLNAGVVPDPGFTHGNVALNYSAGHVKQPVR